MLQWVGKFIVHWKGRIKTFAPNNYSDLYHLQGGHEMCHNNSPLLILRAAVCSPNECAGVYVTSDWRLGQWRSGP